jgi:hypothetical protein
MTPGRYRVVDMSPFIEAMAQQVAIRVKTELESSGVVRPRLLNVKQAAVYLGRTEDSIRHLQGSGALPVVRIDSRVQFDVHDLDRWISQNKS